MSRRLTHDWYYIRYMKLYNELGFKAPQGQLDLTEPASWARKLAERVAVDKSISWDEFEELVYQALVDIHDFSEISF